MPEVDSAAAVSSPPQRSDAEWVGPLFGYDLMRLARRGWSTIVRTTYALALAAGLFLFYQQWFPYHNPFSLDADLSVSVVTMARFAESFVLNLMVWQGAAVVVLTPAYLASAITTEKERRTLELLFTTPLSGWEIVAGKLAARI